MIAITITLIVCGTVAGIVWMRVWENIQTSEHELEARRLAHENHRIELENRRLERGPSANAAQYVLAEDVKALARRLAQIEKVQS